MCGICGILDMKNEHREEREVLLKMTGKLAHRGPDAKGFFSRQNISLGFTRLSIVDLDGGMQPIHSEDNSVVLICNGEIFNYLELRKDLETKGHKFRTNTDIEVILHLYEEYYTDALSYLNGQFAFAIYDFKSNILFCARDHVGIAPFFYTIADGRFIFASEIKAILEHPSVRRELDIDGLDQIMTFPGVVAPYTLFKDIHSLENGHYLIIRDFDKMEVKEYWDLIYPDIGEIEYKANEDYYIEQLDALITQAVKYRLQADVPVGFYVSGGIDSSVIGAKICSLDSSGSRHSFSIDFSDRNISEARYQRLMVDHLNSTHHEKQFTLMDIHERLVKAVYHSECVLKETYNTASMALSEMVNEHGVKVVLTGEGADELFAGYVGYRFDKMKMLQKRQKTADQLLEDNIRNKLWGDKDFFYERDYLGYQKIKQGMYSNKINDALCGSSCIDNPFLNKERIRNKDLVHKRSYIDYKLRLPEHLLAGHGDRMAYANSIEARYPYLDKNLLEFARVIPPNLKLKGFDEKYILKEVARPLIPLEIVKRPKFTFVAPGSCELLKQDMEFIYDMLSYERIKRQGYFNPDKIEALKKEYSRKDFKLNLPFENDLLTIIITFSIFMDVFKLPNI